MPSTLSYAAGVSIPSNFLTAYHVLYTVGKIKAGDKVLIHSVGGGTGLALLQIAKLAGAEVLGTAHGNMNICDLRESHRFSIPVPWILQKKSKKVPEEME